MTIITRIKGFLARENGAMTADHMLLTGGLAVSVVVTFCSFSAVTVDVANHISTTLTGDALIQRFR